jgi:hypothetical protein
MWLLTRGYKRECAHFYDAIERVSSVKRSEDVPAVNNVARDSMAPDTIAPDTIALDKLLARLPEGARKHVSQCGDCRSAARELLEVRAVFRHEDTGARPGPYFLARVMAAIADRERELEKSSQTWAAVPRLAYRLSVLASLTLLVAGGWLYQQPHPASVAGVTTAQSNEGLVDGGGTIQDDFLLSWAER